MTTFTLATSHHTEVATGEGLVVFDFPAGQVTPQSDQENAALLRLVAAGQAVISESAPSKKSAPKVAEVASPDQSAADPVADATQTDPSASAPAADATSKE